MTTFEPGASVVLTQGLRSRPRSTAFFASSAAAIITLGFDVLVHDVIAAMTTEPWSIWTSVPSSKRTMVGDDGRPAAPPVPSSGARPSSAPFPGWIERGSLAGND